jgi:hypothetical protein
MFEVHEFKPGKFAIRKFVEHLPHAQGPGRNLYQWWSQERAETDAGGWRATPDLATHFDTEEEAQAVIDGEPLCRKCKKPMTYKARAGNATGFGVELFECECGERFCLPV